jgi:hypothetical protein
MVLAGVDAQDAAVLSLYVPPLALGLWQLTSPPGSDQAQ